MARHVLIEEQIDQPNNFFIAKDSIWWKDDEIPIILDNPNHPVIGMAHDIKREGTKITAEIDDDMPDEPVFSVLLLNAKMHDYKDYRFISDGQIVDIVVAEMSALWPAAFPLNE